MTAKKSLLRKRKEILRIARKHGARNVRLFGSYANGNPRIDSDVDLLVDVGKHHSPWFPGGLVMDLEELLGKHVDVVTPDGLNKLLKERVMSEAIPL